MLKVPHLDLFATWFNRKLSLYFCSSGQAGLSDRRIINELKLPTGICISRHSSDSTFSSQDTTVSVQNNSYCSLLASALSFSEVLQLLVSVPIRLLFFPNVLTQARGKFQYQSLQRLALYAWELSSNQLEVKGFAKHYKVRLKIKTSIYSESLWCKHGSCTPVDVIKKINPVSAHLTVIADFLSHLLSEKKMSNKYHQGL